jgi:hypothetical protein
MKAAVKTVLLGIVACTFAAPAFAYTINGTIAPTMPPKWVAVHLQKPASSNTYLKLTLSSPPVNAGIGYAINFCVALASAPVSSPCASYSTVAGSLILPGQQAIVFVNANAYPNYVIWFQQGTKIAVPYTVDVDAVP